jgi:hypothetical protein
MAKANAPSVAEPGAGFDHSDFGLIGSQSGQEPGQRRFRPGRRSSQLPKRRFRAGRPGSELG